MAVMALQTRGCVLDPSDRGIQLQDLPKAGQNADKEHKRDRAVQIGVGQKHRFDHRKDQYAAKGKQPADNQHQHNLTGRSGETQRLGAICSAGHHGSLTLVGLLSAD